MMMPTATTASKSELKLLQAKASEQFFAYLYLDNSDKNKYGSIIKGLSSQKSLGNDQYPRTIAETNNVLSNHRFDSNAKRNKSPLDLVQAFQ
mmetsp:Transcript_10213/g.14656  ORF Transcript_10213/g.14656 Transcript_10213/m.14656 type:complete len:92 (+) Transcript_10213:399-674(+)